MQAELREKMALRQARLYQAPPGVRGGLVKWLEKARDAMYLNTLTQISADVLVWPVPPPPPVVTSTEDWTLEELAPSMDRLVPVIPMVRERVRPVARPLVEVVVGATAGRRRPVARPLE
jgi:hypothetical protein